MFLSLVNFRFGVRNEPLWLPYQDLARILPTSTCMKSMLWMLYWMDHGNHHSAGTPIDCSCFISSGIAENDEVVAVEHFIDVGNIQVKSWVGLFLSI